MKRFKWPWAWQSQEAGHAKGWRPVGTRAALPALLPEPLAPLATFGNNLDNDGDLIGVDEDGDGFITGPGMCVHMLRGEWCRLIVLFSLSQ